MADINPPAENVRAMLTETLGRLRKASEEYFGLLEKGLNELLAAADRRSGQAVLQFHAAQCHRDIRPRGQADPGQGHAGRPQDAVRFFSGSDAGADRSGQEHGRVSDEGRDRGLYPKQIGKLRGGDGLDGPAAGGAASKSVQAKGSARSAISYFVAMRLVSNSSLSKGVLGQRFLGSNHIRRRRRVCMTKCG